MATDSLRDALRQLRSGGDALTDGQLLAYFVSSRDEAAFEALLRRHGPMVLGVCRRVLRHSQDAEDAFQAAFLVLASKASSVVKRESLGNWLYGVAYRTALEARAANARRQTREKQVEEFPQPEVQPPEVQDWLPLLDRELEQLPEKYRAAVVLCELEGRSRKEAARQLGLAEGTLSSRLATARRLLASRLSRYGLSVTGATLATDLACAAVPAPLVSSTVRAAAMVAAGQLAAVPTSAALLMKGAMKTMFLQKLKVVAATVVVMVALGVGGLAYKAGGQTAPPGDKLQPGKPRTELEALRRENHLLKLNLEVVLEKVAALETEVRALRGKPLNFTLPAMGPNRLKELELRRLKELAGQAEKKQQDPFRAEKLSRLADLKKRAAEKAHAELLKQVEDALSKLRTARDPGTQRQAADALEKALKALRGQLKPTGGQNESPGWGRP